MTCDGYDIIAKNLPMPNMQVGDWLVLGGMGSYTYGPRSKFNGMKSMDKIIVWRSDRVKKNISLNIEEGLNHEKSNSNKQGVFHA
jgi:hypothetical protein